MRNREKLKGDLVSAAAEHRILVDRTEEQPDGGTLLEVRAWFMRTRATIQDVNRAALRVMETVLALGWRVDVLLLYPNDFPCLVIRNVRP